MSIYCSSVYFVVVFIENLCGLYGDYLSGELPWPVEFLNLCPVGLVINQIFYHYYYYCVFY